MVFLAYPLNDIDAVVNRLFSRAAGLGGVRRALDDGHPGLDLRDHVIRGRARLERARHEMLKRELSIRPARSSLHWLPDRHARPGDADIATVNSPASHISGDFYNWFELPDGRTRVAIGDVTGHGMAAAFLMATTQLLVRTTLPRVGDPGRASRRSTASSARRCSTASS